MHKVNLICVDKSRPEDKTDTHPVKQRNGVKYKRNDKRSGPYSFTSLWELQLEEPVDTDSKIYI